MGGSGIPLWLLVVIGVAVAVLVAVGSILLANRIMSVGGKDDLTVSAFLVVVASEASTLTTMYAQTVAMPESEQTQMRQLLRQYVSAVAGPEWDKQGSGGTSDSARNAITGMYRIVGSQPPGVASNPINGAFLSQLTVLASDRATRIIDAKPRIPPLLFAALIFGGTVLVALTGFLRLGSTIGHIIVSSSVAVLLGLMLCIVFSLDHPFGNERGITPAPFQHAVEVFDAVDRGA